jgi:Ca2+-binding EF-hand superfamily protein
MRNPTRQTGFAASLIILTGMLTGAGALAGGMGHMGADYFKATDTNNDGALTKEEMSAARMQRMGTADTDKDGFISAAELGEHRAAMMRANQDKHFAYFSERYDANKDGKVSTDEIKAFEPPFFAKADANSDGKLSQEEMKAMPQKMHKGMDGRKMDGNKS